MKQASVLEFQPRDDTAGRKIAKRKKGQNRNRFGSVRKINGTVYTDFIYLGERVRESSGLPWNEENSKTVREQLDKIAVAIRTGQFRFAEVFPESSRVEFFKEKESELLGFQEEPGDVLIGPFMEEWYQQLKSSGRVTGRTLLGYHRCQQLYLEPFFGSMTFAQLTAGQLEKFAVWCKGRKLKGKVISNASVNKIFVVLKIVCRSAATRYGWGGTYNPFFGFRKLPEDDPYDAIQPFTVEEQKRLVDKLPQHWQPFFRFAFCAGLRQGEQVSLKPEDVDWEKGLVHIRRALTRDADGRSVEGTTKNKYSRRTIRLLPVMKKALEDQRTIQEKLKSKYLFCSERGCQVDASNVYQRVWEPALKAANLQVREMKQTRHTFATVALSCGENPAWIARVMGHRNTDMLIRVYAKYVENLLDRTDGNSMNQLYEKQNAETTVGAVKTEG